MAHRNKRLLFASPHCLVDFASGAAVATRDALELLARQGFECRAFCGDKHDGGERRADSGGPEGSRSQSSEVRSQRLVIGGDLSIELSQFRSGGVPVSVLPTQSARIEVWSPGEPEAMLAAFERILGDFRPDVLLTYGGNPINSAMMQFARRRGIPVLFGLHNFAYRDARVFQDVDYVVVPSEFAARWYEQRLGLKCHVLPYAIDWGRVSCQSSVVSAQEETPHPSPLPASGAREVDSGSQRSTVSPQRFVTFVNPQPAKGVFVFARIAEQLQRRRPDIPILVVESRGTASWLEQTGLDMSWCQNLHAMENTHDPRDFYQVTKLLLVPSLWNESFGLVAAEAMINGIPVLASDRGALPEVMGGRESRVESREPEWCASGGFLFHIPEAYTPETTRVPTAAEVEPWAETIVRLWDDEILYRECSEKARAHAQQWHPDRLGPVYAEFFRNVRRQPGPSLLKSEGVRGREGEWVPAAGSSQLSAVKGQSSEYASSSLSGKHREAEAYSAVERTRPTSQVLLPASCTDGAHDLTTIVIVTHNQVAYTKLCIESIRRHTAEPYELIVVDNGSTDGTVEWVKSVGRRAERREPDQKSEISGQGPGGCRPERVTVIANAENRGFPAAANQGIRAATGQHILLLNNDIIVTDGWLTRLLRALRSDTKLGMVGPVSNFVSGPQQVAVDYERRESKDESRETQEGSQLIRIEGRPGGAVVCDLGMLDEFARKWGEANEGRVIETDRLVGFCLLIRRELVDRIGIFDERFGIGNFEDDDLCRRARAAGFRLAIATDSFVHHFGGRTFIGARVDHGALMRRNEQLYREKWSVVGGQASAAGDQSSEYIASSLSDRHRDEEAYSASETADRNRMSENAVQSAIVSAAGPQLSALRPLLSLCMIARDNERTIGAALEVIRKYVDDIVVVDTGSKDRTPEIAASFGARVFHFPWCDDFSAARNESIRHALGRWIFWMDTDDVIDDENARKIRELVLSLRTSADFAVVSAGLTDSTAEHAEQRRGLPVLGYLMKVRCPSVGENGDAGYVEVDQVKLFRNLPHLRFELRIHEQILMAIRRAGGTTPWTDIFVVHANADLSPEGRARKIERDLRILQLDHQERPDHPFVLFNLGMTLAEAGRHAEAIGFLWQSIGRAGDDDSHLRKTFALLVSSYRQLGRHITAWETCLKGLRQFPDDPELRFRQATMLRDFGNLPDAARAFEDLLVLQNGLRLSSVDRAIQGFRARQNLAAVYTELGEFAKAEEQWRLVVEEVPNDPAFRERHCRLLFEHFPPSVAEPAFRELVARDPQNAAALHNLGSILYKLGRFDESIAAYRESLKHRSNSAWTHLHLGYALWDAGQASQAIGVWKRALPLATDGGPVREEIGRLIAAREGTTKKTA